MNHDGSKNQYCRWDKIGMILIPFDFINGSKIFPYNHLLSSM